jgi:hypothetical protein
MKVKNRYIAIAILGIAIFGLFITAIINRDISRAILSSERVGMYEITAMKATRANNEVYIFMDNENIQFPLPNGAVEFENMTYPVNENNRQFLIRTEALQYYLNTILPQNGFEYDQLGALIIVNNEEYSIQVNITTSMFSRYFMRIIVHQ